MALFTKGSELDRWAVALGVGNDDEAMRALTRLMAALKAAQEHAAEVASATTDAPDPEVSDGARSAVTEIDAALDELVRIYHKFQHHYRGGR
jgi:hypothetical protein